MNDMRVGLGYDIHRFAEDRKLVLGGVEIPYERGLLGHSDADVVLHAVCDAILGALGMGDIGEHFPNTDSKFKDARSVDLLQHVVAMMREEGYEVNNLDVVVVAEEPKINSFKQRMKDNILNCLGEGSPVINIKATTQEGLGSIGAKEGIASWANVSLKKVKA